MNNAERMVISAYEDDEVESPWKAQVEQRLASDPRWAAEAEAIQRLKAALAADPEPDFATARARVTERLAARPGAVAPTPIRPLSWAWVSVAAAALLLVASGTGFWLGRQSLAPASSQVAELQVQVPKTLQLQLSGEGQLLMASTLERTNP
jgi:anti-sigma factor RsiW